MKRQARSDERGVTLILFTLMLTVMLLFVALAMDSGLVFNERRQDQSAVDAAVLGAAQILLEDATRANPDPDAAKATAVEAIITQTLVNTQSTNPDANDPAAWKQKWRNCNATVPAKFAVRNRNDGSEGQCIAFRDSTGPKDPTQVWAHLPSIAVQSTFGGVVGIDEFQSSAEAIGEIVSGSAYVLFADARFCDAALNIGTGSPVDAVMEGGRVHSNGMLDIGEGMSAAEVTYVSSFQNDSPGVTPRQVAHEDDPLAGKVTIERYSPGGSANDLARLAMQRGEYIENLVSTDTVDNTWLDNHGVLVNGKRDNVLVYSAGRIVIDAPLSGSATFVSEKGITFQGDGRFELSPWSRDPNQLLAFTDAGDAGAEGCTTQDGIELSGVAGSWRGLVYAPNGRVRVSGSGAKTFTGSLVANVIDLQGADYRMDVVPGGVGPPKIRLFR